MVDFVFGETVTPYGSAMEKWIGSLAVVTGASAGIGASITEMLSKCGINVVGIARRVEMVEELANNLSDQPGKIHAIKCDLEDENNILETFAWIDENLGPISIMINNAGFIMPTTFIDGDTEMWKKTINVNILAVCICTREAIKYMQKHGIDGHIINLNSVVGHYVPEMPFPALNIYPATKFAVTGITEGLRQELRFFKSKIKISAISPGLVGTEFLDNFNPEGGLKDGLSSALSLKPEDVANAIMYVLATPPNVQVHDLIIRVQGEAF